MKSERDSIRVGSVSLRRYWRKGWLLPDGSYTMNPLAAQYAAESEDNRRKSIKNRQQVTALTIKRRAKGPKPKPRPEDYLKRIAERRGLL